MEESSAILLRRPLQLLRPSLPNNLPTNFAIPDDLREHFVPIGDIRYQERATVSIDKQHILAGARFDEAIGLLEE